MDRGRAYERSLSPEQRRVQGIHYTPAAAADEIVALALDGLAGEPIVCDPACGGGALLLAAARALEARSIDRRRVVEHHLWGADVDPAAVDVARASLADWSGADPGAHLVVGDSLLDRPWSSAPAFDAVIGNPPFQNQLATATARPPVAVKALRDRFGDDLVRPFTDTAWLFLVAAVELAAPGGRVVLVQPQSILAARDASAIRAELDRRGRVEGLWTDGGERLFDASVEVCAPVIQLGAVGDGGAWSSLLAVAHGVPTVEASTSGVLGDISGALAGFRDEYYGLVPFVREGSDVARGAPLVTSGLVDLGRCAWGERPARFAKRRWDAPVVDLDAVTTDPKASAWVARQQVPKVIVAAQTRVLEAAVDEEGAWIASVPTVAITASAADLWRVAAALCSPATTAWAFHHTAGTALSSDAVKLSAGQLLSVPLPEDERAWDNAAESLAAGAIPQFATAIGEAYGIDDGGALVEWWSARRSSS